MAHVARPMTMFSFVGENTIWFDAGKRPLAKAAGAKSRVTAAAATRGAVARAARNPKTARARQEFIAFSRQRPFIKRPLGCLCKLEDCNVWRGASLRRPVAWHGAVPCFPH